MITSRARVVLLLVVAVLIGVQSAWAATPEQTVKEIVDKIKAAESPSPIIEYVDWDGAYGAIPAEQRVMMKVTSSDEMKGLYRRILEDPVSAMKERMKEQMAQIPPDQQAAAQQQMVHMEQMIGQQKTKMTEQIKATDYEIGKAAITGNSATVKLTQSYQGQKREEEISMVKKGDKWLLSSMDMFKPRAAPPAGGPAGGPPGAMPPSGAVPPSGAPMQKGGAKGDTPPTGSMPMEKTAPMDKPTKMEKPEPMDMPAPSGKVPAEPAPATE